MEKSTILRRFLVQLIIKPITGETYCVCRFYKTESESIQLDDVKLLAAIRWFSDKGPDQIFEHSINADKSEVFYPHNNTTVLIDEAYELTEEEFKMLKHFGF